MDFCSHKHNFGISAKWDFLEQATVNLPALILVEQLNDT